MSTQRIATLIQRAAGLREESWDVERSGYTRTLESVVYQAVKE